MNSITQIIAFLGLIIFSVTMIILLKTHNDPKERKKIYVGGAVLLLGYTFMLFSTEGLTEKEYLQEIAQITVDSDEKIKQTNVYSDAELNETVEFLGEELEKLDSLVPPESLPQEIKDSHDTLYKGVEQIKTGIDDSDAEWIEKGQTGVAMAQILYSDYIDKNPELFEE
ncbi:hypothetical protein [Tetragenococcus halophilus]|nr:hypothetical protein [Tetragenococcus halophilus]